MAGNGGHRKGAVQAITVWGAAKHCVSNPAVGGLIRTIYECLSRLIVLPVDCIYKCQEVVDLRFEQSNPTGSIIWLGKMDICDDAEDIRPVLTPIVLSNKQSVTSISTCVQQVRHSSSARIHDSKPKN
jgi:hypothetical protein